MVPCTHHIFGYKLAWPARAPGLDPTAAKDRHSYTNIPSTHETQTNKPPIHTLASFQNGLGCTLLQHLTSDALLTSLTPPLVKESSCVGRVLAPLVGCTLGARWRRGFSPGLPRATRSRLNQWEMFFFTLFPTSGSRRLTLCPSCDNNSLHRRRSGKIEKSGKYLTLNL